MLYIIRGPFQGKGNRKYVIVRHNGKRRRINYAKYLLLKEGIEIKKYQQVHHVDGDSTHDVTENLSVLSEFKHKKADKRIKRYV